MKNKKILFYFCACVLIPVIFFGVIELATRIMSWMGGQRFTIALHEYQATDRVITKIYQWHPFTGFIFTPNYKFRASHPNQRAKPIISIDQHGFLSNTRNYDFKKSADEIRIATIGASTTANINLPFEENWPGRLGFLLQEAFPQKKITILNAGVPGFDTAQSIGNLALRVMPFKPDIVIIYHAYNDLKAIRTDTKFSPDYSHIHQTPYGYHKKPGIFKSFLNHSMFYVRVRNKYHDYVSIRNKYNEIMSKKESFKQNNSAAAENQRQMNIPPEAIRTFAQHVRSMVGIAKAGGAKVILSSFATLHDPNMDYSDDKIIYGLSNYQKAELSLLLYFTPGLELTAIFKGIVQYNETLKIIAQQELTGWVDNAARIPHDGKYFVDRVHFSQSGAKLMAENFFPVVRELLN